VGNGVNGGAVRERQIRQMAGRAALAPSAEFDEMGNGVNGGARAERRIRQMAERAALAPSAARELRFQTFRNL